MSSNRPSFAARAPSPPVADREHPELAELALLIDAIPAEYRVDVLRAALRLDPNDSLEASYLVGTYRTRLCDCLTLRTATVVDPRRFRRLDQRAVENRLVPFAMAEDPAEVALALDKLMNLLATAFFGPSRIASGPQKRPRATSS